jgi:hypothetical protein
MSHDRLIREVFDLNSGGEEISEGSSDAGYRAD